MTVLARSSALDIYRAVTYGSGAVSVQTIAEDWTKIYFTIKQPYSQADASALVQIVVTNGGDAGDGLLYLNGAAATAAQASLTVDDETPTVTVAITDNATAALPVGRGYEWSMKALDEGGDSTLLAWGMVNVYGQATLTI